MRYISICSGIEAATVAWHHMGWQAVAFSEIAAFPRQVLQHHYPDVPLHGDFTVMRDQPELLQQADLLVGGTPCQAFSVAGARKSLADDRGNLTLEFVRLADAIDDVRAAAGTDPAVIVWENVPGVLSVKDNAFGCFLAGLAGDVEAYAMPKRKWGKCGVVIGPRRVVAWRTLDAQWFGVAQRRRRVFVVASARTGFDPVAVLFEREGLRRNTAPRRGAETEASGSTGSGTAKHSHWDGDYPHPTLNQSAQGSGGVGCSNQELFSQRGAYLVPSTGEIAHCLNAGGMGRIDYETKTMVAHGCATVRKLTPVECERLQGFPDGYTDIPKKVVSDFGHGPCAKMVVRATIVAKNGTHYVATNHCDTPQQTCARAGMPTGQGYELCKSVCNQRGHAEENAIRLAKKAAKGATLYLEGHTYACVNCITACERAGIAAVVIGKPPGTAPDGGRYKALGNSMAVPVMRWIGERINGQVA